MRERLIDLLGEIEDIDAFIQNGCIDSANLACFKGVDNEDQDRLMSESNRLTQEALTALNNLLNMMKEGE